MNLAEKSILVTGGAGFLGSAVVRELQTANCTRIFVPRSSAFDLTKEEAVGRVYEASKPDVVIHLAALVGGIGANRDNPGRFFYDNLMMGTLLMEHGRRSGVEKFVAIGTVCCYPKHTSVPFKEDDLWSGYPEETNAPYGLAKKMLLVQSQAYRHQYDFRSIFLLPVNLYGPGDNFSPATAHVLPALIRRYVEAKDAGLDRVTNWGSGSPKREFLYVDDLARAIVLLLEDYDSPETINVGTGEDQSIREIAELVAKVVGYEGEIFWDTSKPDGMPRKMLDVSRLKALGWRPTTSLEDGLRHTVKWFHEHRSEIRS